MKELQSLCLNVRVLDEDGNEIELKDDDDDFQPGFKDDETYSDDNELEASGYSIEEVENPDDKVDVDALLNAMRNAGSDDDSDIFDAVSDDNNTDSEEENI